VALSIFASLGLGLASPYLLIGFVPASRGFIPKPGQWMVTFRNFLAFPMFATVVWMVWILSIQTGSTGVFLALAPMVMIGFGLWAAKVSKGLTKGLAVTVSLVVVVYGLTTIKPNMSLMPNNGRQIETSLNVIPFSYAKLANLRMEGKNVFIHHWAAWCMICLIHENLVFETEDFQKFLRDTNTVFMQADRTNNDPELLKFMEETYGRSSQPIDVFYTANMMDKPIVFPTLFTTAKVIHLMRERMREMAVINANN
jgi:thiol:disulfide interchange protein DsbD